MRHEQHRRGQFDAIVALGVIPHFSNDDAFVASMVEFCRPQGTHLLQFRNALFSMLTFNRLTKESILDELMVGIDPVFKDAVAPDLEGRLAMDKPAVRRRGDDLGHGEIRSRFHNPCELADVVRTQGFSDVTFPWYNYYPTPHMLAAQFSERDCRKAQVASSTRGRRAACSCARQVSSKPRGREEMIEWPRSRGRRAGRHVGRCPESGGFDAEMGGHVQGPV